MDGRKKLGRNRSGVAIKEGGDGAPNALQGHTFLVQVEKRVDGSTCSVKVRLSGAAPQSET